tara:strand:+ start:598 stop:1062 length:465 start_codon:yes stop_codon:yes gene_type:complete
MANISTYPQGTPAAADLIPGTQKYTDHNGKRENQTRNFTVQSLGSLINAGFAGGYNVYTALITQAGAVNPPVATIMQNTLGGTIAWTRTGIGAYTATIADALFTLNKTMVFINGGSATATANIEWASPTTATVTIDTTVDSVLTGGSLEIRVYT